MTSNECAKHGANIIDISQTVMKEYFAMIMLTELDELTLDFSEFSEKLKEAGRQNGVEISVMHEDIFNAMHRI
jgi:ACT domain-containing protein